MPLLTGARQILLCRIGHLIFNSLFAKTEFCVPKEGHGGGAVNALKWNFFLLQKNTSVKLYFLPFIVYCPYVAFFRSFSNLSGSFINLLAYLVFVIVSTPPHHQAHEAYKGC